MGPAARYTLRCNTASIMKIDFFMIRVVRVSFVISLLCLIQFFFFFWQVPTHLAILFEAASFDGERTSCEIKRQKKTPRKRGSNAQDQKVRFIGTCENFSSEPKHVKIDFQFGGVFLLQLVYRLDSNGFFSKQYIEHNLVSDDFCGCYVLGLFHA